MLWVGNVGTMLDQWVQFAAQGYLVYQLSGLLSLYVMVSGITPFSALLMGALIDAFGA